MSIWTKVEQPMDVKVIVPYMTETPLLQTVVDALRYQFVQPELRKVEGSTGYWDLWCELWGKGEQFIIVEHDVVVWPGAIKTLAECPEQWCALPAVCRGKVFPATFCCAKFSPELIAKDPDLWKNLELPHRDWGFLDAHFGMHMRRQGFEVHNHWPAAIHLNELHWPDSISTRFPERKMVWKTDAAKRPTMYFGNKKKVEFTQDGIKFMRKGKEFQPEPMEDDLAKEEEAWRAVI